MKTFKNTASQGDLYIKRVDAVPEGFVPKAPTNNVHIVAHSETGHHHVLEADPDVEYFVNPADNMKAYVVVRGIIDKALKHLRPSFTHDTILFKPGTYELRRQREATPQGWRRVED